MQKKSSATSITILTHHTFLFTNNLIQASQPYKQTKNRKNKFKYINPSFPNLEKS